MGPIRDTKAFARQFEGFGNPPGSNGPPSSSDAWGFSRSSPNAKGQVPGAKSFVDTGERPCHYRVLTLFGEALYCRKNSRLEPRPELTANDDVLFNAQIATNAGAEGGMTTTELIYDPEIIAFAKRMHAAIPEIALMGCDVLRDANPGELFALETNSGGNTWAFSSELGKSARAVLGKQAMIDQFGAWDVAARALVLRTREEAV